MALKSSREGLRKELVDYLGNIIIDENLKQNIINSVDDVFINNEELTTSVNELDEKIRNETSARENADNTLQNNINAESTARQEAVTNIEELINNGVLKMDLLWTNASLSSQFVEQSVSIPNLAKYKLLYIICKAYRSSLENISFMILNTTNSKFFMYFAADSGPAVGYKIAVYYRTLIIQSDSIYFYRGVYGYSTNDTKYDDESMIPYQIYGVR